MPRILFRESAIEQLKQFILRYEEGFFRLYKDGGIWAEDVIIEQYRQIASTLQHRILQTIEKCLIEDTVLGRKEQEDLFVCTVSVGDRLVTVYFSENTAQDTRVIESIEIDRKQIFF